MNAMSGAESFGTDPWCDAERLSGIRRFASVILSLVLLASASVTIAAPHAALADAIEKKDLAAMRALLGDTDVNAAQVDGMTALHWAVHHDDLATAKALIAARANP